MGEGQGRDGQGPSLPEETGPVVRAGRTPGMTAPERLSCTAGATAVEGIGWRHLLSTLNAAVPVTSMADVIRVGAAAVTPADRTPTTTWSSTCAPTGWSCRCRPPGRP